MARCRDCAFPTGLVAPVPAFPAVVPSVFVAGGGRYNAALAVQIKDFASQSWRFPGGSQQFFRGFAETSALRVMFVAVRSVTEA